MNADKLIRIPEIETPNMANGSLGNYNPM